MDRDDADAAARRVLADYLRQQQGAARAAAPGRGAAHWLVVLGLAGLGAALGAAVGALRGQSLALGVGLGLVGLLLGLFSTRR